MSDSQDPYNVPPRSPFDAYTGPGPDRPLRFCLTSWEDKDRRGRAPVGALRCRREQNMNAKAPSIPPASAGPVPPRFGRARSVRGARRAGAAPVRAASRGESVASGLPKPSLRLLLALDPEGAYAVEDPTEAGQVILRAGGAGVSLGGGAHPREAAEDLVRRDLARRAATASGELPAVSLDTVLFREAGGQAAWKVMERR